MDDEGRKLVTEETSMHKPTRGFKDERYVPNEVRGKEPGTGRDDGERVGREENY